MLHAHHYRHHHNHYHHHHHLTTIITIPITTTLYWPTLYDHITLSSHYPLTACTVLVCGCSCCSSCSVSTTDTQNVCSKKGNTSYHESYHLSMRLIDTAYRWILSIQPIETSSNPSHEYTILIHSTTYTSIPSHAWYHASIQHASGSGHCHGNHDQTTTAATTTFVRSTPQITAQITAEGAQRTARN